MALRFHVAEFGRVFATRARGQELRDEVVARAGGESVAVIDFNGVTNVSYSFADEFVGKLSAEGPVRIELAEMTPSIERLIARAVARRNGNAVRC